MARLVVVVAAGDVENNIFSIYDSINCSLVILFALYLGVCGGRGLTAHHSDILVTTPVGTGDQKS